MKIRRSCFSKSTRTTRPYSPAWHSAARWHSLRPAHSKPKAAAGQRYSERKNLTDNVWVASVDRNPAVAVERASVLVPAFDMLADHRATELHKPLMQPDLEIGERLGGPGPFVDEVRERPERFGCLVPFPEKGRERASALSREKTERSMDKPVEGCDADMGMLLMLWANILPHLAAFPFFHPPALLS